MDFRIAARALAKSRGFAAVAVLTLGLGIALNVAVFAVLNAYLLRSLPYPEAKRLYNVIYARPGQDYPRGMEQLAWETLADVIEHPISWDLDLFSLMRGEHPETAPGGWVTPGFMEALGIHPAIGRAFSPEEFRPGSPQVALISHTLWQNRFGGDPAILGRRFEAYVSDRPEEAESFAVIGVLPRGFWHVNPYTEVLAPLRAPSYPYMARLREGVPPGEAARRITALVKSGAGSLPADFEVELRPTHAVYVAGLRPVLRAVAAAAGLVLLIACANVAVLLLIRATRRQKEIAVRLALGAGRGHVARTLFAEALLIGAAATAVGVALSRAVLESIAPVVARQLGRSAPGGAAAIAVDGAVLVAAVACGLLTAVLFTLTPLAVTWRTNLVRAMHSGQRSGTEGAGSRRTRSALIALEVAASLALLAGCGLMIRTVTSLVAVDLGYRGERVLMAGLGLRVRSYPDGATRTAFYDRLLQRLAAVPGVESAATVNRWPLHPPRAQPVEVEGSQVGLQAAVIAASPDYFSTLGIPVIAGRSFSAQDRSGAEPVAVVSETLARSAFAKGSAVGRRLLAGQRETGPPVWRRVVGVVRDVRQGYADDDRADVYLPMFETGDRFATLLVRTAGSPAAWLAAVRQAVKEVDADLPLNQAHPFQRRVEEQMARPKFLASLLSGFAVLATLLCLVGVYGVIAYAVRQREREIAVRIAVGADERAVTRLFLRQGARVLGLGIAAGLIGAVALGRALESQLYGVQPGDPWTLAAVAAAFGAAGIAAVWWPARRAARTDPAAALREE